MLESRWRPPDPRQSHRVRGRPPALGRAAGVEDLKSAVALVQRDVRVAEHDRVRVREAAPQAREPARRGPPSCTSASFTPSSSSSACSGSRSRSSHSSMLPAIARTGVPIASISTSASAVITSPACTTSSALSISSTQRCGQPPPLAACHVGVGDDRDQHQLSSCRAAAAAAGAAPPPLARSAVTVPPCASATWRTIARPEARARQAAGGRRAVEAVEHVGQVGVRDAGPVVADGDLAVAHADLDLPAGRAPLGGVVDQVRDRAVEARGHSLDQGRLELGEERPCPARAGARARPRPPPACRAARPRAPRPARRRARGRRGRRPAPSARRAARPRRRAGARGPRAAARRTPAPRCSCAGW